MKIMRKSLSVLLSVLMIAALFTMAPLSTDAVSADESKFLFGDLNGDGLIGITDLSRLIQYVNGSMILTEELKIIADVNGDGAVDESDVEEFQKCYLNDEEFSVYSTLMDYGLCGDNAKYVLKKDGSLIIFSEGDMESYSTQTSVPWYGFRDKILSTEIKNGISSIGDRAFEYCISVESITIPDSVTSIGYYAFMDCTSIKNITIPNSVTSIGYCAFYSCTSLTSITIPESVTSIVSYALGYYSDNGYSKKVDAFTISGYSGTVAERYANNNGFTFINLGDIMSSNDFEYVVLDDGTVEIAKYIGNSSNVQIPSTINGRNVTSIGSYAFYKCESIKSVKIPDGITSIGVSAFEVCTNLTNVTIGKDVTSIGSYVFCNCTSLASIEIPNSVTSIGLDAFYRCVNLKNITIPDSVTYIGMASFGYCESLTSIVIPDSVTTIDWCAFWECTSLTSVTIGSGVRSIGLDAFIGCKNLKSVTIPDNVTNISSYAFGYYYDNDDTKKVADFTISGYRGTEAERYATDNGFTYISLDEVSTTDSETLIVPGFYLLGSEEVCGAEWDTEAWRYSTPMEYNGQGDYYYKVVANIPKSEGNITDEGNDVYEFKVIYINENGDITWHPDGMGNNTVVKVEEDGSTIAFTFVLLSSSPNKSNANEAVVATVYSPKEEVPVVPTLSTKPETTEPKATEPPTTEVTESTERSTTEPVISKPGVTDETEVTELGTTKPAPTEVESTEPVLTQSTRSTTEPSEKKTQKITAKSYTKIYGSKAFSLKAKTSGNGKLTYKTSNKKVATVSSKGKVTIKGCGKATITIKAAATSKYKTATKKVTVTVKPQKLKIKIGKGSKKAYTIYFTPQKTVSGYECTYKNGNKNHKITVGGKGKSFTLKNLVKGNCMVKIRAYKKSGKTKLYGAYGKMSLSIN